MLGFIVSTGVLAIETQEGYVDVKGGRIWYQIVRSEQTKDNIPLVVLHGGPGFPHTYLNVLKNLAEERPVIFYDQLGCGRSSIANNDNHLWKLTRFEEELETLIQHLHLKKIHLFGHSWGGALASEYALKHSKNIQSLTLASPLLNTQLWEKDSKQLIAELPADIQTAILTNEKQGTTDSPEYIHATDVYYHHFCCRMREWPHDLTDAAEHMNLDVYHTMWGANEFSVTGNLKNFNQIPKLKELTMPVWVTGGRYDEARPETLAYATKQIPHAHLKIYEKSAHVAFLEEQDLYLSDLRQFLQHSVCHDKTES